MSELRSRKNFRTQVKGFTLVELVMVIVVLSILSLGSVTFISRSAQGLVDSANRQVIAGAANIAAEKVLREVRRALPNSIRTFADGGNQCLEFVPILFNSEYLSVPVAAAATQFDIIQFNGAAGGESGFAAVYPSGLIAVYGDVVPTDRAVSDFSVTAAAPVGGVQTLTFDGGNSYRFPTDSPGQRLFLVSTPVAFCDDASGRLWRYENYGFQADSSASLPATGNNRRLIADSLLPGSLAFSVVPMQLRRNAVVRISLTATRDGDSLDLSQEVQLRNVP